MPAVKILHFRWSLQIIDLHQKNGDLTSRTDDFISTAMTTPCDWSSTLDPDLFVERVFYHGVAALLMTQKDWPQTVQDQLRKQSLGQAVWELQHRIVISDVVKAMNERDIRPLLLKGTALAYDLYAEPAQRSRGDTDILVARSDLSGARTVLGDLGFGKSHNMELSDDLKHQEEWVHERNCTTHAVDLHWSMMNSEALRDLMPFSELERKAVPLNKLCNGARSLSRVDALIFACLHRAKHFSSPYFVGGERYDEEDRLVWINDIKLLSDALTKEDWTELKSKARDGGFGQICWSGLKQATDLIEADIPIGALNELARMPASKAVADYLLSKKTYARSVQDIRALPSFGAKFRFIRQNVFPPKRYLERKYPDMHGAPAWRMHLRRISNFLLNKAH